MKRGNKRRGKGVRKKGKRASKYSESRKGSKEKTLNARGRAFDDD